MWCMHYFSSLTLNVSAEVSTLSNKSGHVSMYHGAAILSERVLCLHLIRWICAQRMIPTTAVCRSPVVCTPMYQWTTHMYTCKHVQSHIARPPFRRPSFRWAESMKWKSGYATTCLVLTATFNPAASMCHVMSLTRLLCHVMSPAQAAVCVMMHII